MIAPGDGEAAAFFDYKRKGLVGSLDQFPRAPVELVAEPAFGGGKEQAFVGELRGRIDAELEAGQVTDRLGADADLAVGGDGDWKRIGPAGADVADEDCGAAVDEALGETLVERVAQSPFDLARALGPLGRFLQPILPV